MFGYNRYCGGWHDPPLCQAGRCAREIEEGNLADVNTRPTRMLARIRSGGYRPTDFIIADAKDGDIGGGAGAPGPEPDDEVGPTGRMKPVAAYRAAMKKMIASDLVDIMPTSLSSAEALAIRCIEPTSRAKKSSVIPL